MLAFTALKLVKYCAGLAIKKDTCNVSAHKSRPVVGDAVLTVAEVEGAVVEADGAAEDEEDQPTLADHQTVRLVTPSQVLASSAASRLQPASRRRRLSTTRKTTKAETNPARPASAPCQDGLHSHRDSHGGHHRGIR